MQEDVFETEPERTQFQQAPAPIDDEPRHIPPDVAIRIGGNLKPDQLIVPIEFISTFLVRPFSLMVRLFANMLAGHLILVTFAALTAGLWAAKITVIIAPFSFALLVAMTGFEILVSFLQAFIFTILTAVYIGGAMHPEH